jgi:hypothetical protein
MSSVAWANRLYAARVADPDLLIRSAGEICMPTRSCTPPSADSQSEVDAVCCPA